MTRAELAIAWRYLRSRRGSRLLSLISLIAIGGVAIGVSALIVIMGVMTGLQDDLREKILIGSPDVRVLNASSDMAIKDWREALSRTRQVSGVVSAAPFVFTKGIVSAGRKYGDGAYIMGLAQVTKDAPAVTAIRDYATAGDFQFRTSSGKRNGVVVGTRLANRLGVYPGVDSLRVLTLGEISPVTGQPTSIEMNLEVTGLFETGMYEYDNGYVFVDIAVAEQLAGLHDEVSGLEVRTRDRWTAPAVATKLAGTLGFPYRTEDWQAQNSSLFQALKLE